MAAEREIIGHNNRPKGWFTTQDGHVTTVPATEAAREWAGLGHCIKAGDGRLVAVAQAVERGDGGGKCGEVGDPER